MFDVGMFGPGVFQYEALRELRMELSAAVITGAQVVLLGLLSYLAFTRWRQGAAPAPPKPPGTPELS